MAFDGEIVDHEGRRLLHQTVDGCLFPRIGSSGLRDDELKALLGELEQPLADLRSAYRDGILPHLHVPEATADLQGAESAMARLCEGARLVVFMGTGGSSLGGQTLAQLAGWNIPGAAMPDQDSRPRTRFYDNLDPATLEGALAKLDFATTRFVITSKSGGTPETLAQAVSAIGAMRRSGLESEIPRAFLALTDPPIIGKANGLRDLAEKFGFSVLDHPPGIGGRFSGLTIVGMLPAIARGLDVRALRRGARAVVQSMLTAEKTEEFAPAVAAAVAIGLNRLRGVRVNVMMPYADRLARYGAWYVQLWAESLGKGGAGSTPVACLGPLDQHSQLQLFMDGPAEHYLTIIRAPTGADGPVLDADLARTAGIGFMADRRVGELVEAQSRAVPEALMQAGRPVRTIDLDKLDPAALGALMMSAMIETILAARLLGVDAFDQPAVELAKTLTRQRLSSTQP
jgi:glucose-6-phosphate isomerase